MFTGLVEEVGFVEKMDKDSGKIIIATYKLLDHIDMGDSIAVNGVCLTVTGYTDKSFSVDVMPETFRQSNLGSLKYKDKVNLERAMKVNGRFGGHFVSGHIDGTGIIRSIDIEGNAHWVTIETSAHILKYIVPKGSIAVDGISLTVVNVGNDFFKVSIIPHTGKETILFDRKAREVVNLECDMIAKYVDRLLHAYRDEGLNDTINIGFLEKYGFLA